jgi:hypothetical protein
LPNFRVKPFTYIRLRLSKPFFKVIFRLKTLSIYIPLVGTTKEYFSSDECSPPSSPYTAPPSPYTVHCSPSQYTVHPLISVHCSILLQSIHCMVLVTLSIHCSPTQYTVHPLSSVHCSILLKSTLHGIGHPLHKLLTNSIYIAPQSSSPYILWSLSVKY